MGCIIHNRNRNHRRQRPQERCGSGAVPLPSLFSSPTPDSMVCAPPEASERKNEGYRVCEYVGAHVL
jgi:hypothetical protein